MSLQFYYSNGLRIKGVNGLEVNMKNRLEWLFISLSMIGVIPVTLGFFNIGREFFSEYLKEEPLKVKIPESTNILLHTHCHEMALIGRDPARVLLKAMNCKVQEIPEGCCGMAGSFGYEEEHHDISLKIANLKLFPAIKKAPPDALIIANGTSCRSQILFGEKKEPLHMAELLHRYLK